MSKHKTIETIRKYNPTAAKEFLSRFAEADLHHYLRRLTELHGHRGPGSVWVRPRPAAG